MKKSILLAALFLASMTFASCKGNSANKQDATENAANSIEMTETQADGPIHLTQAEFLKKVADYKTDSKEWKYLGDKPAIIDFYATWCGPCKQVAPLLEELSKEYAGQIVVYKVDVDKEPELASDFGIQSIPTIWFVPMKGEPKVTMGAMSKEQLKDHIEKVLLKK